MRIITFVPALVGITLAPFLSTPTNAQLTCTDKSTPRECYEAGLDLIGKTLATLQAKEKELDAKIAALTIPTGAIMAFDLRTGCPAGWKDYIEAMGRVIIGADPPNWIATRPRNRDGNDRQLTSKKFEEYGGSESFTLAQDEIPSLEVTITDRQSRPQYLWMHWASQNQDNNIGLIGYSMTPQAPNRMNVAQPGPLILKTNSKGAEHKHMTPYISLFYCIKG